MGVVRDAVNTVHDPALVTESTYNLAGYAFTEYREMLRETDGITELTYNPQKAKATFQADDADLRILLDSEEVAYKTAGEGSGAVLPDDLVADLYLVETRLLDGATREPVYTMTFDDKRMAQWARAEERRFRLPEEELP